MPELPEAETIARGLRTGARGRSIRRVEVIRPDVIAASPRTFTRALEGARISEIGRRGKNLVLTLDASSPSPWAASRLVVNLGMSGRLLLRPTASGGPVATHPAVRFHLDDESVLVYHDVRRFGRLAAFREADFAAWSDRLGPEPLSDELDPATLKRAMARSKSPIRSWLLDQSRIAGVGNIYANEALWHAGIHPRRPAREIGAPDVGRLRTALRTVLTEAIEAGGTTLRDYRTADGWPGSYGASLRVYGRDGSACARCERPIVREVFAARSAFYCPRCQPPPGD